VQPYGIQINDLQYFHEGMGPWINAADPENAKLKRKFIVRIDPRDISRVFFYEPNLNMYLKAPTRGLAIPPTPVWEYKEARAALIKEGRDASNEHEIAETLERIRRKAAVSVEKTKSARRAVSRRQEAEKGIAKSYAKGNAFSSSENTKEKKPILDTPGSIFSMPIKPFSDIE
jgi:putative transposase